MLVPDLEVPGGEIGREMELRNCARLARIAAALEVSPATVSEGVELPSSLKRFEGRESMVNNTSDSPRATP